MLGQLPSRRCADAKSIRERKSLFEGEERLGPVSLGDHAYATDIESLGCGQFAEPPFLASSASVPLLPSCDYASASTPCPFHTSFRRMNSATKARESGGGTALAIISRRAVVLSTHEKSKKSGKPWSRAASCGVINLGRVG